MEFKSSTSPPRQTHGGCSFGGRANVDVRGSVSENMIRARPGLLRFHVRMSKQTLVAVPMHRAKLADSLQCDSLFSDSKVRGRCFGEFFQGEG